MSLHSSYTARHDPIVFEGCRTSDALTRAINVDTMSARDKLTLMCLAAEPGLTIDRLTYLVWSGFSEEYKGRTSRSLRRLAEHGYVQWDYIYNVIFGGR